MSEVTPEILAQLIDGRLPWALTKEIMSGHKDPDRFDKFLAIRQARVPWRERILLPLEEHLSLVVRRGQRLVKCDCGHELGEARRRSSASSASTTAPAARPSWRSRPSPPATRSWRSSSPMWTPSTATGWAATSRRTERDLRGRSFPLLSAGWML